MFRSTNLYKLITMLHANNVFSLVNSGEYVMDE
jgi:hypothetical protein